jgi:hypothetical protein
MKAFLVDMDIFYKVVGSFLDVIVAFYMIWNMHLVLRNWILKDPLL